MSSQIVESGVTIPNSPLIERAVGLPLLYALCPVPRSGDRLGSFSTRFNNNLGELGVTDRVVTEEMGTHDLAHVVMANLVMPPDGQGAIEMLMTYTIFSPYDQGPIIDDPDPDIINSTSYFVEHDWDAHEYKMYGEDEVSSRVDLTNPAFAQLINSISPRFLENKSEEEIGDVIVWLDKTIRYNTDEIKATHTVATLALKILRSNRVRHYFYQDNGLDFINMQNPGNPEEVKEVFKEIGTVCRDVITGRYDDEFPEMAEAREVLFMRNARILLSHGWSRTEVGYRLAAFFDYTDSEAEELLQRFYGSVESGEIVARNFPASVLPNASSEASNVKKDYLVVYSHNFNNF